MKTARKKTSSASTRPPTWRETLDSYSKLYCMDTGLREAATIAAATLLTTRIPGDPIWMFMKGPASTGKTVIVESLGADTDHCEVLSKFTATQLVSGYVDPEDRTRDVSIFPRLRNRALLVPDFTTVLAMGSGAQEELYGLLRDCYGGKVRISYGNGKLVEYTDVYFPIIAAVTDEINNQNRSHLGERFLHCETIGVGYNAESSINAAIDSTVVDDSRKGALAALGDMISRCIRGTKVDLENVPGLESGIRDQLIALCQVIGYVRAFVPRDHDDMVYRPRPEGGGRVAKQLNKLGISLAYLLRKDSIDDDVFQLVRKVGMDSVSGISLDTIRTLMTPGRVFTTDNLKDELRLPKTSVARRLGNLEQIGIVRRHVESNGKSNGRHSHVWQPNDEFLSLWNRSGLSPRKRRAVV